MVKGDLMTNNANQMKPPVVTHLTQVRLRLDINESCLEGIRQGEIVDSSIIREAGLRFAERFERVAAMIDFLKEHGFVCRTGKRVVCCFSNEIEAYEIKRALIDAGFNDPEFQIVLEYTRGWGML